MMAAKLSERTIIVFSQADGSKKADVRIHPIGTVNEGCHVSESLLKRPCLKIMSHWLGPNAQTPAIM